MLQLRWRGHDTTLVVRNTIRTVDIVSKVVGQGVASSELQMPHLRWRRDATTQW